MFFLHTEKAAVCFLFILSSPQDADLLDVESKHFEDLEFQQLEHESRLDEEKENLTQQLLREVAEYQRNIVARKVICQVMLDVGNEKLLLPIGKSSSSLM